MRPSRRQILQWLGGVALAGPVSQVLGVRPAHALSGRAERILFLYFPDGVPGPSASGEPSAWHAAGSGSQFTLPDTVSPLEPWRDEILFFRNLSMGSTDSGSHPGGAKKLLTARDGGMGESIDQYLSRTVGASSPWRHLYLGVMANHNGASGDKHIVYPSPGVTIPPLDDPRAAFASLFGGLSGGGGASDGSTPADPRRASLLDHMLGDLDALRARLGTLEQTRLDLHLQSIRELELRLGGGSGGSVTASCDAPGLDTTGVTDATLYDPAAFPDIARSQIDLAVLAMACGLTRVATIQMSHHTSELIMSRFPGTEMHDPGYDMRSHQASHYGPSHDPGQREYAEFVKQRRWFASQYAYLIEQLASRPEGDGTMLDHSLVVLCTEVCDGNTHLHDDLPVLVAGRAGGRVDPGRVVDPGWQSHGSLWAALAHAMGEPIDGFGAGQGVLDGVLS